MNRLRHHSQNHTASYQTPRSPPKSFKLYTIDPTPTTNIVHRPSPSAFTLEDPYSTGKFTGRVTKNVGLKKYNQRQLKEVMNNREPTYLKTESNGYFQGDSKIRLCTEGNTVR